jgi:hypothetical protein
MTRSMLLAVAVLLSAGAVSAQGLPKGFTVVKPDASAPASQPPALQLAAGRFFTYARPAGWRVGEDGQFALTLVAPDSKAVTVMVGNAGMPPGYPPARFAYEKLMGLRPEGLQLGAARPAKPGSGFAQAWEFPVTYRVGGVPCQGIAKVHVAPAYDTAVMAMTAALSESAQWQGYAPWLPLVAEQVSASNGAAFGMRGVMAQNLQSSTAYAEAARQYRDWSQRNWQGVTDARNASQARNNAQFREALGGVQTYANPYDARTPVELPSSHRHYWINEHGTIVGTNDPSIDPNAGSTRDWRRMPQRAP